MKQKRQFPDWLGTTGLAILAVLVFGMGLVSFGMGHRQELNRLDKQRRDIEDILQLLSEEAEERRSVDQTTTLPGVDVFQRQIGSATDGCEVTSNGCQATISGCTNLRYILEDPYLSLPADIETGSEKRSGYVVWLEGEDMLVVASCAPEYQEVRTRIPGLRSIDPLKSSDMMQSMDEMTGKGYASNSATPQE